jgi:hypothetical protein
MPELSTEGRLEILSRQKMQGGWPDRRKPRPVMHTEGGTFPLVEVSVHPNFAPTALLVECWGFGDFLVKVGSVVVVEIAEISRRMSVMVDSVERGWGKTQIKGRLVS